MFQQKETKPVLLYKNNPQKRRNYDDANNQHPHKTQQENGRVLIVREEYHPHDLTVSIITDGMLYMIEM